MSRYFSTFVFSILLLLTAVGACAQAANDENAIAIIAKAVQQLGGDRYLNVTSQVGRGYPATSNITRSAYVQTMALRTAGAGNGYLRF